jgi:hypothetical protein
MKNVAGYAYSTGARGQFGIIFAAVVLLCGCQAVPQKVSVDFAEPAVAAVAPAVAPMGPAFTKR